MIGNIYIYSLDDDDTHIPNLAMHSSMAIFLFENINDRKSFPNYIL